MVRAIIDKQEFPDIVREFAIIPDMLLEMERDREKTTGCQ